MVRSNRYGNDDQVQSDKEKLRLRGYQVGKLLGEGTYAKVREGLWRNDVKSVRIAIKIINRKNLPKNMNRKFLPRELDIVAMIRHPSIIQTFEIIHINYMTYITMECAKRGDLLDYIHVQGILQEREARVLFSQVMNALKYLHENNIVHRDLKCENILIASENKLKLADFGFAREYKETEDPLSETFCGSPAYAAPEIIQGTPYNCKISDVWSCGVILFTMTIGCMPFRDHNLRTLLIDQKAPLDIPRQVKEKISEHLIDYLERILVFEPDKRLPVEYLIEHDWLTGSFTNRNYNIGDSGNNNNDLNEILENTAYYNKWYYDCLRRHNETRQQQRIEPVIPVEPIESGPKLDSQPLLQRPSIENVEEEENGERLAPQENSQETETNVTSQQNREKPINK